MIVPSMNTRELVKEILQDSFLVKSKANYLCESLRRKAVKAKDKCYFQLFEYKSQRQNNWLIVIYFSKGIIAYDLIVYYLNEHELNAISVGKEALYRYSPHFLIRYNERCLKQENISKLDLLKQLVSTNKGGVVELNPDNQCIFCRFTEEVGLSIEEIVEYHICICHLRTFISNEMIFNDQQQSLTRIQDYYEKYGLELQKATFSHLTGF